MTKKIIIFLLALGAISAKAETLEIDGFVITTSDGCQIVLSLDGEMTSVIMPNGKIKRDESGIIESVGGADLKRNDAGKIESVGSAVIERDESGKIVSVDNAPISRDSSEVITEVKSTKIERNDAGEITGTDGLGVRALFKVSDDKK
ncbi:MAG TPA: hypothetical protein VIR63_00450 [Pontiella sp.]